MWSFQHLSRQTPVRQHAPARSKSASPQRSAVTFAPLPFLPVVRAKLRMGASNDESEQEADRVADQVMRMTDPGSTRPITFTSSDLAQRGGPAFEGSDRCETRRDVPIGSNPRPLSSSERAFFEPRFGCDFRHVRLHADATAARSAESLKARAFTFGRDIAFAPGQYQPATNEGRKLLAHELTHTLQQQTMAQPLVQRARHTGQGDYLDPDNCWVEGETKGPSSNVIGRFIGILDVPEKCEGAIKMTVRFEAIGGWSVTSWLGPSAAPLLFTPSAVGVDPASFVNGKAQATDSFFEYDISYPLTPEDCPTKFDAYLLVTWRRPAHKPNFAEVKFSPNLFWEKAMAPTAHARELIDGSPDPVVRVDSCGRLVPTPVGNSPPAPVP
jgi:hypothetical protein